jgi:hypothetical protein
MIDAAFDEHPATELARILTRLARQIARDGVNNCPLYDVNGNPVGFFVVKDGTP